MLNIASGSTRVVGAHQTNCMQCMYMLVAGGRPQRSRTQESRGFTCSSGCSENGKAGSWLEEDQLVLHSKEAKLKGCIAQHPVCSAALQAQLVVGAWQQQQQCNCNTVEQANCFIGCCLHA